MERIICEERCDEGLRPFQDGCCGTIRTIEAGGDKRVIEVKVIGQMDNTIDHTFESANRVYDKEGLSPTINTCGGGGLQPKVIVASRGRNPDNLSDRTAGNYVEQRFEPNSEGICNCITTITKDNMVLEPKVKCLNYNSPQSQRVYETDGVMTTIDVGTNGRFNILEPQYRIRKLTPLECWRLMGFTDEDFYKAKFVFINEKAIEELTRDKFYKILYSNLSESKKLYHIANLRIKTEERMSNTQLYKQAGNSIVVNVLEAIFKQML